jgi:hypothetical protein
VVLSSALFSRDGHNNELFVQGCSITQLFTDSCFQDLFGGGIGPSAIEKRIKYFGADARKKKT